MTRAVTCMDSTLLVLAELDRKPLVAVFHLVSMSPFRCVNVMLV